MTVENQNNLSTTDEPSELKPLYKRPIFWVLVGLFLGAFLLRVALTLAMEGHPTDINNFRLWSKHAALHPFREFYKSVNPDVGIWADYPPLYILVLAAAGRFYALFDPGIVHWNSQFFTFLVKLPSILADLGCMALLLIILKRYIPFSLAFFASFIFAIHPAVIYESAMWGQIDSVTLVLQLLATWFLIKKDFAAAILVTTLNILVKPQGLILMPLVLFLAVYHKQWLHLLAGLASSALVTFVMTALFVPFSEVLPWLWAQYASQADLYGHSSIMAFNVWSFTGIWTSDVSRGIFGLGGGNPAWWLQHKTWGLILFSIAYAFSLGFYWFRRDREEEDDGVLIWHVSTLIMVAFFLFPTRMHERYLYSGLFFLLGSSVLQRRLLWIFGAFSFTFMLNLLYELPGPTGYKKDLKFPGLLYSVNDFLASPSGFKGDKGYSWFKAVAGINIALYATTVYVLIIYSLKDYSKKFAQFLHHSTERFKGYLLSEREGSWIPEPVALDRKDVQYLGIILFVSALIKLWRLDFPPEMVFDEVYHARAAGEFILGIKPLEWVHPPLAKLLISVGVHFYELVGVGWRVMPVIAGTLLLASVYALARFILPERWQAVAATIMLACDGVYFVQSRMAMTNIFATLFQVTALMFTWRFFQLYWYRPQNWRNYIYFLCSVFFMGLALSTRWTSLYSYMFVIFTFGLTILVPSTLFLFLSNRRVQSISGLQVSLQWLLIPLITVLLPFCMYLVAYAPYYIDHNYDIAKVLKEQVGIWNYHSQLQDPHPYYSAWYTWPWLTRPTWYYFQKFGNNIAGIIALGNPAIWWASLPFVVCTLTLGFISKRLNYLYIGIACLFMYLPWGLSPRTLNYAHYYFEAVPYACLCAAALMGVAVKTLGRKGQIISASYFTLVCVLFCFFYPVYSALPIPGWFYNMTRWFPSWV